MQYSLQLAAILAASPGFLHGQEPLPASFQPLSKLIEKPVSVETSSPKPGREVKCYQYKDFAFVVESDVSADIPNITKAYALNPRGSANPQTLCKNPAGGSRANDASPGADDFVGRFGSFIVFSYYDSDRTHEFLNLATRVSLPLVADHYDGREIEIRTGREKTALRYSRTLEIPCPLMKEGGACWKKILKTNSITLNLKMPDCLSVYEPWAMTLPNGSEDWKSSPPGISIRIEIEDLRQPKEERILDVPAKCYVPG